MTDRKEYIDKLAGQLKEWDNEIESIETKAKTKALITKDYFDEQLSEMKAKREIFAEKLSRMKESGDNAWVELKNGIEKAGNELKESAVKAREIIMQ